MMISANCPLPRLQHGVQRGLQHGSAATKTSGPISPTTPSTCMNMINKHNLPPSGKVILLSKLKCGLLLTISLATVSFNTINVPTSLCNNGILFFACHSIIIMSAYCTFPSSKLSLLYQNVRLTMSELCNKTTLVQQKTTKCS